MLLQGDLEAMDLSTLVQLKGDEEVKISVSNGKVTGEVFLGKGKVLHARVGDIEGEAAFFQMLSWDNGSFTVSRSRSSKVTIGEEVSMLLLRGAQVLDEDGVTKDAEEGTNGESTAEHLYSLVEELVQIPSIKSCGVLVGDEMVGAPFSGAPALVESVEALDKGFEWGEIWPCNGGKLVIMRIEKAVFFFLVDPRYEAKKLFRVVKRRLSHAATKG